MKIYLAAPWAERDLAREVAAKFEAAGHVITKQWWDHCDNDDFAEQATEDIWGVLNADVLVLLNTQKRGEETSGKAFETGVAWMAELPIILVGEPSNVFHYLPAVKIVKTVEEALGTLDERSV